MLKLIYSYSYEKMIRNSKKCEKLERNLNVLGAFKLQYYNGDSFFQNKFNLIDMFRN